MAAMRSLLLCEVFGRAEVVYVRRGQNLCY